MLVVDLHCDQDHHFEGWFGSSDDLASQQAMGLLSCPVCGSHGVARRPSAPHLNVSGAREVDQAGEAQGSRATPQPVPAASQADPAPVPSKEAVQALQAMYLHAVRRIVQNTEDVGRHFADEVRRMHHGEEPERAIRGQATAEEKAELKEEGIAVMSLAIPDGLDGPLQ